MHALQHIIPASPHRCSCSHAGDVSHSQVCIRGISGSCDNTDQQSYTPPSYSHSAFISPPSMSSLTVPRPSPVPSHRLPPRPSELGEAGPSYVIISGGTGANSIVSAFGLSPAFVLPVSDDGGSSAEILRCFGGPSIGDISKLPSGPCVWSGPRGEESKY